MIEGYGELGFQLGLLDENQKAFVNAQTAEAVKSIKNKDFVVAFNVRKYTAGAFIFKSGLLL